MLQVKRSGMHRYRGQPLAVVEFIRRWLQHVCPSGLHRVRHYGFLHAHSRRSVEELRLLIAVSLDEVHYLACSEIIVSPVPLAMVCQVCGGPMLLRDAVAHGPVKHHKLRWRIKLRADFRRVIIKIHVRDADDASSASPTRATNHT